ncbi:hypothetical protein [Flexivirga oryzae]|uniref:Uncharacterized protein n=1 Tax=Flexivirga oryzae TaxID=1794944 RepID=A0A839N8G9_9MICO|nr:hypothetical protein [Flexivirga oryzae]MBB2891505.1 hypothetical protein [Flexivirga oryzae]
MSDDQKPTNIRPAAQVPLSSDLVERLGEAAHDYAEALWSVAQHRDADADQMASLITEANDRFGVRFPEPVIDKLQEIFRNSGGFVTIISEEHVLAGAISDDVDALDAPHAANAADESTDLPG